MPRPELAARHPASFNMRVGVQWDGGEDVRFLYRVEEGAAERSYGIFVAKLAGLPPSVLNRARDLLHTLESSKSGDGDRLHSAPAPEALAAAAVSVSKTSDAAGAALSIRRTEKSGPPRKDNQLGFSF